MLVHLHVKNLALIEDIEVEFGPGLNILTGETGAGKSILLRLHAADPGRQKCKGYDPCRCVICTGGALVSGRKSACGGRLLENLVIELGRWSGTS